MTEVGLRDRWVMTGLVVLGLLTILAGGLSGRSTIDYVLSRDAREAALAWSAEIDQRLRSPRGETTAEIAGDDIQPLNATALEETIAGGQGHRPSPGAEFPCGRL